MRFRENGVIKLIMSKQESVVHNFGDGSTLDTDRYDNIKEGSFQWMLGSIEEKPNRVIVHWIDRAQKYNEVTVEYNDRIDQEDRSFM